MKQILCTFILSFAVLVTSAQTVSNKKMPFVDGDRTVTFRYVNKQVKHVTESNRPVTVYKRHTFV